MWQAACSKWLALKKAELRCELKQLKEDRVVKGEPLNGFL
jgi:hypothetical protein